ncbi:MAG: distant relative of cell wall-associated hydrolase [Burkholderiales bacterium]|jgi:hypothetical protein|nr:distant relative of cell wall-associated hydrolase [Burkholderiales bacterium]
MIIRVFLYLALLSLSACATQIKQTAPEESGAPLKLQFQRLALTPEHGAHPVEKTELKIGDIALTANHDSLVSLVIRLASVSPVSHAAIYVGDDIFVEAVAPNVRKITVAELVEEQSVIAVYRHPELTEEQRARLREIALAGVGRSYNFIGVALQAPFMVTRRVCEIPFIPGLVRQTCYGSLAILQMPLFEDETSFCSQYVLGVFQDAGVPLAKARAHWVSPRDLMHMRENDVPGFDPYLPLHYAGHLKQSPPLAIQQD